MKSKKDLEIEIVLLWDRVEKLIEERGRMSKKLFEKGINNW